MMKMKKTTVSILGILAILGMGFNLWAYGQLQTLLVPSAVELPAIVNTYTLAIMVSFLFISAFHLMMLFHTFYLLPRMKKSHFWGALFFCALVLSGIFIASDASLLHDLGEEYRFWDVTEEWQLLTLISSCQMILMAISLVVLLLSKEKTPFAFFPKSEKFDEGMFLIVTQVGLICGLIGLAMLPIPSFMDIDEYYRPGYLISLSVIALLPFISSIVYWLIRNRGKHKEELLDEKQFQDIAFGALLATILLVLTLLSEMVLSTINLIDLNNPLFYFLAIDILILVISGTVLLRSRQS